MTMDRLQKRLAMWQRVLRLEDWRIVVRFVRQGEMPDDTRGRCEFIQERKEALISIVKTSELPENPYFGVPSEEVTLVHELLHLHVEPGWREDRKVEMELAVEMLAQALVGLSGGPRK